MRIKVKTTLVSLLIVSANVFSAPPPPPTGGKPKCWPPPCIPIDGGISLLVVAGALYGGKKLYNKSKSDKK